MGQHLDAFEKHTRPALKAQGQARATLETLAAIRNPPVMFARQANIAHGPQQVVGNGPAPENCEVHVGNGSTMVHTTPPAGVPESLPAPESMTVLDPTWDVPTPAKRNRR